MALGSVMNVKQQGEDPVGGTLHRESLMFRLQDSSKTLPRDDQEIFGIFGGIGYAQAETNSWL